jgi:hypothetical protein
MSKVMAFVAGFLCSILLFAGSHSPLRSSAQDLPSALWAGPNVQVVPTVPPLPNIILHGGKFTGVPQVLDGMDCTQCEFNDAALMYGGGAFRLQDIKVSGTTHLTLIGAAANTVALLNFLNGVEQGVPAPPSIPEQPIKKASPAKIPMTKLSITPPFISQR